MPGTSYRSYLSTASDPSSSLPRLSSSFIWDFSLGVLKCARAFCQSCYAKCLEQMTNYFATTKLVPKLFCILKPESTNGNLCSACWQAFFVKWTTGPQSKPSNTRFLDSVATCKEACYCTSAHHIFTLANLR